MSEPKPKTLAAKLAQARAAAKGVEKKGHNDFQNYDYVRAVDVTAEAEKALEGAGLVVIPSVQGVDAVHGQTDKGKAAVLLRVDLVYTVMDSESGESIDRPWVGYGYDTPGDKAIYKAITGAGKYFYAGLLGIPFGDDPENETAQAGAPQAKTKQKYHGKGFVSDKQRNTFHRALKEHGAPPTVADAITAYASSELEGHRDGPISLALDGLLNKEDRTKGEDMLDRLKIATERWQESQSDLPADTKGLPAAA